MDNQQEQLTEEQRKRIESNRLAALAKRKAISSRSSLSTTILNSDKWTLFKCRKITHPQTPKPHISWDKFKARLEICSPDSFSVSPFPLQGFGNYPGDAACLQKLTDFLAGVMPSHYTQTNVGGKACVYKLGDYDAVVRCLKVSKGVEVEEIPWSTFNVIERLSRSYVAGRWMSCRPEHLNDEHVDEVVGKMPKKLLDALLPFQLDGLRFGLQRGGRCLIADDMGLGKTLQAIAIAYCYKSEGPILVVCPAVLRYSWAEELERWLPFCLPTDVHLVFGHQDNPANLTKRPSIVVISYKMLHHLKKHIMEQEWAVLIVDESHHIRCSKKNSEPQEIRAVLDVATKIKHIILLSGTPSMSRPGLLGKDKYEFAKTYCDIKSIRGVQGKTFQDFSRGIRLEELNVLLRQTVMIRRLKEHVLGELPPIRRQIIRLLLKKSDIASAQAVTDCKASEELTSEQLGLAKLSGFREWLSIHPILAATEGTTDVNLDPICHKMIIFAHHHKVLDGIQEFLCEKGISFVCIDGRVMAEDRQSAVLSFRSSSEVKVAIVGITAGGIGIDLSSAPNVVILELPQNPMWLQQAESRAHRRGQIHGVNVYIFCAKDTQDESRWQRLNKSVQRVSSTTDGKYDSKQGISIEGISYVDTRRETNGPENQIMNKATSETISPNLSKPLDFVLAQDLDIQQNMGLLEDKINKSEDASISSVTSFSVDIQNKVGHSSSCNKGLVENSNIKEEGFEIVPEADTSGPTHSSKDSGDNVLTMRVEEQDVDGPVNPKEAYQSCPEQVDSLRFEVSKYTGRIHLFSCIPGTDSRPKPLFVSFQPQEIELMRNAADGLSDECLAYSHAILLFLSEWDKLRPIQKRKLFGKPLQLPLTVELCCLSEGINHCTEGLLKSRSTRRTTPLHEISFSLPSNAVWKKVHLCSGHRKREKEYTQGWTLTDEPLCKFCQKPCMGGNAKTPEFFEDLFCDLQCYEEYRIRTSNKFLRQELYKIERGICTNCQLDCHQLVQHLKRLSLEKRQEYIEKRAPQVARLKRLLLKLVDNPIEGNAWHADHIVPVYKGGGECRLENMRTLCVACHADVTAAQCAERRTERNKAKKQLKVVIDGLKRGRNADGSIKKLKTNSDQGKSELHYNSDDMLLIKVPGSSYSERENTDPVECNASTSASEEPG